MPLSVIPFLRGACVFLMKDAAAYGSLSSKGIDEFNRKGIQHIDDLYSTGLDIGVTEHDRDSDHQAKGRCIHRHRDPVCQECGLLCRVCGCNGLEGLDEPYDCAQQSEEGSDVGQGWEIMRTPLQLRHDGKHGLFNMVFQIFQ